MLQMNVVPIPFSIQFIKGYYFLSKTVQLLRRIATYFGCTI